jgi:hypothetical protein
MAKGEIIGWLNSDDTYEPGAIEKVTEQFKQNPECVLVYGNGYQMDREGENKKKFISGKVSWRGLSKRNRLLQPSVFFRKSGLADIGDLDDTLHYVMDFELWIRFFRKFEKRTLYLPEFLSNWRIYSAAKTGAARSGIFQELFKVLRQHYGDISSSWMVLYIAEILLGYDPSKGIRSFIFHQKWPIAAAFRSLNREYGFYRTLTYLGRFFAESPLLLIRRNF